MPTHKPDLSELSTTQLVDLTGKTPRTVSKRLDEAGVKPCRQDGKTNFYRPQPALAAIYGQTDPFAEKRRLDSARADAQEMKNAQMRGELVPALDLDRVLISLSTMTSARLQAVPAAIAAELASESEPAACHAIVEREIHAALEDLARAGREAEKRLASAAE